MNCKTLIKTGLACAVTFVAVTVNAQQQDSCAGKLLSYTTAAGNNQSQQYIYQLTAVNSKGQLVYYGARHSSDTADSQFADIKRAWNSFQPTVAFYEGPDRGIDSTEEAAINKSGESGYIRFLAKKAGIPIRKLENPVAEYEAMVTLFGEEKTALFYLLREAQRLSSRKQADSSQVAAQIKAMLQQMAIMRSGKMPFNTVEDIIAAYGKYWLSGNWWQAPAQWFLPQKEDAATGGLFTNTINKASSEFRNRNMYKVIAEAIRQGEKVFVVAGRDHVPQQIGAIRCSMGL